MAIPPKTLTAQHHAPQVPGAGREAAPFQAGCCRCSDVTKPRFSVGVCNRFANGVLTHRAFSGLAALCHGGRWGCQAGGGNVASKGPGGAVAGCWRVWVVWQGHCLPRTGKQRQRVGVACGRRWHTPKKNPARGRDVSDCQLNLLNLLLQACHKSSAAGRITPYPFNPGRTYRGWVVPVLVVTLL